MERDIEKYLNYLIANQDFFQQTTSTICGMVEIEQVELNREQQERERQRDREQMNYTSKRNKSRKSAIENKWKSTAITKTNKQKTGFLIKPGY
ncbi:MULTISPECIES: hypothetical protein [unclassified Microcoleus]